jgi:diguanylate cyclase (GGDEF)-like protein/PAS domain S-box-containing protein
MQETTVDREVGAGPIWWGATALIAAFCIFATAMSHTSVHEAIYTPGVLVMAAGFAVVVRYRHLQPLAGWTTFAVGLCLLALGDLVYAVPWSTDIGSTGLTAADPLYLLGSIVIAAGALRIKGAHVGERDREALIDAVSIGLAAAILLWRPLIEPRLNQADSTLVARMVNGSFPVLDVIVLAMMLWLLLGNRRWTIATTLLVGGALFYLVADLAYTVRIDQGTIDDPSLNWLDSLWLVAYGLYLLAALHPSARLLGRRLPEDDRPISRSRLLLSGAALLAPILAIAGGVDTAHIFLAVGVEAVLVVLVLIRLSDLASGERRARQAVLDRERYFRSLVQNAAEAMVVLDRTGAVTDASPAVRSLLGVAPIELAGNRLVDTVPGLDREAVTAMLNTASATPDVVITGEVAVASASGATRWLEVRATNLLDDPAVGGLVVNLHDATARRQVQADLERRAFTDPLTGLANRALFQDRLDALLSRREPPEIAVVYCDLDGFKAVNDRFGHAEGDHLLQLTATRLTTVVRAEDTVARLGGDEFAVLVHGTDASVVAETVAERIVDELGRPLHVGPEIVPLAVSVGVAWAPAGSAEGARVLMHAADEAMYRAKRAGGDRVVVLAGRVDDPTLG